MKLKRQRRYPRGIWVSGRERATIALMLQENKDLTQLCILLQFILSNESRHHNGELQADLTIAQAAVALNIPFPMLDEMEAADVPDVISVRISDLFRRLGITTALSQGA